MAWLKKTARKAEQKVFGSGGAKRRYGIGKGKGGFNFKNVLKDIESIKGMLNVEKNYLDRDVITTTFAQVSANADGVYCDEITPVIVQGDGKGQRIGNSLKLTGMSFPLQFSGDQFTLSGRKIRFTLVRSTGHPRTSGEVISEMYDVNPINAVCRDYNAPRKYTKGNGLSVIRSKTYYLKPPTLDNGSIGADHIERSQLTVKFNVKLNDVLRYTADVDSAPNNIRYFIIVQTDVGNDGAASTLDVPIQQSSSGVVLRMAQRSWYVDN